MFEAQLLIAEEGAGNDVEVFSPWFPRAGNNIRVIVDMVKRESIDLTVELYSKKSDETGNGAVVSGGSMTVSSEGRTIKEYSGLEDMVRYRFELRGATGSGGDWVLFRMLSPVWFDAVEA